MCVSTSRSLTRTASLEETMDGLSFGDWRSRLFLSDWAEGKDELFDTPGPVAQSPEVDEDDRICQW